jgi:hypothetical protein
MLRCIDSKTTYTCIIKKTISAIYKWIGICCQLFNFLQYTNSFYYCQGNSRNVHRFLHFYCWYDNRLNFTNLNIWVNRSFLTNFYLNGSWNLLFVLLYFIISCSNLTNLKYMVLCLWFSPYYSYNSNHNNIICLPILNTKIFLNASSKSKSKRLNCRDL